MAPLRQALPLALLLGLAPLGAQDAASLRLPAAELPKHAFPLGGLQATLLKFKGQGIISYKRLIISLHNPTPGFLPFAPEDVALVGADGTQSLLCGWFSTFSGTGVHHGSVASHVRVAPGATLELAYVLDQEVKLPAKLYLGDRLAAEITD